MTRLVRSDRFWQPTLFSVVSLKAVACIRTSLVGGIGGFGVALVFVFPPFMIEIWNQGSRKRIGWCLSFSDI
jgi:hypothetical protein